jgi:Kef-type K+ transport system membrane component KefB
LRDATTIFFFTKVGLSKDLSLSISLISFIFLVVVGCIGGIIYVLTLHSRRL